MSEKTNTKLKGKKMKKLVKALVVVAVLLSLVSPALADLTMVGMLSEGMGSYVVWESAEKVSRYHVENGRLVFVEKLSVKDYPLNSPVYGGEHYLEKKNTVNLKKSESSEGK